jgi:predicted ATPase
MQGTDTEERGVRGGGGGMLQPNREKIKQEKRICLFTDCRASGASEDFLSELKDVAFCK